MRFPHCISFFEELTLLATNRVSSRIWLKFGSLLGSALDSLSKSRGFESHLMLDNKRCQSCAKIDSCTQIRVSSENPEKNASINRMCLAKQRPLYLCCLSLITENPDFNPFRFILEEKWLIEKCQCFVTSYIRLEKWQRQHITKWIKDCTIQKSVFI